MFSRVFMVAMYRHFDRKNRENDTVKKVICMGARCSFGKWKGATQKGTDYIESWEFPKSKPLFVAKFMASDVFRGDEDLEKEACVFFTVRSLFKRRWASYLLEKHEKNWCVFDCVDGKCFLEKFCSKKPEDAIKNALNRHEIKWTKKDLKKHKLGDFYVDYFRNGDLAELKANTRLGARIVLKESE